MMHEYSVMTQIVETVLLEAKARNAQKVLSVALEVGDLTFLGHDQLDFAWRSLTEGSELEGADLDIESRHSLIECKSCGYRGSLPVQEGENLSHFLPRFCCPECEGPLRILEGNGCLVKNIKMVVDDVPAQG